MRRRLFVFATLLAALFAVVLGSVTASSAVARSAATPWSGNWSVNEITIGSPIITIQQTGTDLKGSFAWLGCNSKYGGTFSGTVSGSSALMNWREPSGETGTFEVTLPADLRSFSGTWMDTGGSCVGEGGLWNGAYVGPTHACVSAMSALAAAQRQLKRDRKRHHGSKAIKSDRSRVGKASRDVRSLC
jgi:hypothetical protein